MPRRPAAPRSRASAARRARDGLPPAAVCRRASAPAQSASTSACHPARRRSSGQPSAVARVEVVRGVQRREQRPRGVLGVEVRRRLAQQDREVRRVELRRALRAARRSGTAAARMLGVALEQVEVAVAERAAAARRRARRARAAAARRSARPGTRACGRRAARARGRRGRRSGGRACRCPTHAARATSSIETCVDAALGDELGRGGEDAPPVARRVGALARGLAGVGRREARPRPRSCRLLDRRGHLADEIGERRRASRAASSGSARAPSAVERAVGHADGQLGLEHVRAATP